MRARRSQEEVQRDVIDALISDVRLDASDLNVEVTDGVVRLQGSVPNLFQRDTAQRIVERIKGVLQVVNELQVTPAAGRSDEDIAADVKGALLRDTWVDESKITVRVDRGTVYLEGRVASHDERAAAEDDARFTRGVKKVVNAIEVVPAEKRLDPEIASEIRLAILREFHLGRSEIDIQVRDGVVFLRGSVWANAVRKEVEDLARRTRGVRDVINELSVVV